MNRLQRFFASMTGRIFTILLIGMVGAALIATAITGATSNRQFSEQLLERTADRLESYAEILDAVPAARTVASEVISSNVRLQPHNAPSTDPDPEFREVLIKRGGVLASADAHFAQPNVCLPELYGGSSSTSEDGGEQFWRDPEIRKAIDPIYDRIRSRNRPRTSMIARPTCRLVDITLTDGTHYRLSVDTPWIERERSRLFDPLLLSLLVAAVGVLAYFVARIASAPLHRLSDAATDLGQDLDRPPVDVSGPSEVQRAAEAFNSMQQLLKQHVNERTHMLASITHDLQTPLTRLRLRLERIDDEALRDRLVGDLSAMNELIDEGLELARSAETSEPRVMLDLDSLLESLVEDAADAGAQAEFQQGCGAVLQLRPLVARRLFSNLIDNAIKYGGCALVSSIRSGTEVAVQIADRGPGVPP
ncbi:HAMP domain-containing protein, partial [Steroidobacter sp.]|uniref:HAMP domain-containing protein n=1 Tax=Steroidobacter sp. TaxID=1978227 RepID=UPI001A51E743